MTYYPATPNSPAPLGSAPVRSGASIVAILCAIASFAFSFNGREVWALFAAFIAIAAGLIGGAKSLSPRVSGGIISLSAVALGVLAVFVALIALIV
ncbi:MAG: hypothetical protein QM770_10685 [Tepidisphaeraceae bacterium]